MGRTTAVGDVSLGRDATFAQQMREETDAVFEQIMQFTPAKPDALQTRSAP